MSNKLTPPQPTGIGPLDRWLNLLWRYLNLEGQITWGQVSKSGSNLTDIETRNHADLQNLNTASYTHLTATNHTDLTDAGDSTLHYHASDRDSANFTGTSWTDLTDGGTTALHSHAGGGGATNNVISTPTTVSADTSYIVMQYLTITAEFTVLGNVGII